MSNFILRQLRFRFNGVHHNNGEFAGMDLFKAMLIELSPKEGELLNISINRTGTIIADAPTESPSGEFISLQAETKQPAETG